MDYRIGVRIVLRNTTKPINNLFNKKFIKTEKSIDNKSKKYLWQYKQERGCADCLETDPVVLEFDHIRGEKEFNVGEVGRLGYSLKRIKQEIDKCEVICANCHRKRTHRRTQRKSK